MYAITREEYEWRTRMHRWWREDAALRFDAAVDEHSAAGRDLDPNSTAGVHH